VIRVDQLNVPSTLFVIERVCEEGEAEPSTAVKVNPPGLKE